MPVHSYPLSPRTGRGLEAAAAFARNERGRTRMWGWERFRPAQTDDKSTRPRLDRQIGGHGHGAWDCDREHLIPDPRLPTASLALQSLTLRALAPNSREARCGLVQRR
jgi:hypothetical protein